MMLEQLSTSVISNKARYGFLSLSRPSLDNKLIFKRTSTKSSFLVLIKGLIKVNSYRYR